MAAGGSLVVVNKERLAKGARLSCSQVRVMRQLVIGALLATVGLSCLLAMAQLAYDSIVDKSDHTSQYNDISQQAKLRHKFDLDRGISESEVEQFEQPSWYWSLMKPLSSLFGFARDSDNHDRQGDEPDGSQASGRRTKLGYLNHKRFQEIQQQQQQAHSEQRNGSLADMIASAEADSSDESPSHRSAGISGRSQLMSGAPELSASTVIQVDRIKGLDLPALSDRSAAKLNRSTKKAKSARIGAPSSSKLSAPNYEYANNIKCLNSKYDRVIAQKLSLKEISKPVITSDGRFDNPFPTWKPGNYLDLFEFMFLESDDSGVPKDQEELERSLPMVQPQFISPDSRNFHVTWIGHSTLLIQIDGFNVLTDPVFSDRASPVQFLGPKRIRKPACEVHDLPQIDVVLISHNHFDHLDADSVKALNSRFGQDTRWIVPLGLADFLKSSGVENYVELDWWQKDCFHAGTNSSSQLGSARRAHLASPHGSNSLVNSQASRTHRLELDIYLTPAQHWSRRGISDFNKSLWGSYTLVSSSGSTFFFSGDTGYCSAFKEVSKVFGPFTGAAIAIGAYKPRWFLKSQHVDPEEAVQIHRDLRSRKSIAIHHSTFVLSKENYMEPKELLSKIMANATAQEESGPFLALNHGESTDFPPDSNAI